MASNTPRLTPLLCLLLVLGLDVAAAVQPAGDGLRPDSSRRPVADGAEIRHPIRLDPAALQSDVAKGESRLPSTDGKPLLARNVKWHLREDGRQVWTGTIDTETGEQTAILLFGKSNAFGLIPQRTGAPLRIETRKGQSWLVEGEQPLPEASEGADFSLPPLPDQAGRELRARQLALKADGDPVVDLLVLYTPTLVSVWGSHAAVQDRIAYLEQITNQAYVDSNVGMSIRVVGTSLVDYTLTETNGEALERMTSGAGSDPLRAEATRLRALYGADLVKLLRNYDRTTQDSCGNGWINGYHGAPFEARWGFSVTADHGFGNDNCGEWTFAHEIGHNLGAHHDKETADDDYGAFTYSRGFRQTLTPSSGFATIMAYSVSPQTRIGRFSNPRLTDCVAVACGDAVEADNARGFTEAAAANAALVAAIAPGALPTVSIDDTSVVEGNAGTRPARFTISLSSAATSQVTLSLATQHGSAVGADFVGRTATVFIQPGQSSVTFDVQVRGDAVVETDEVFALNLTAATGARIIDGQGVATITNDEPIPTLTVANVSVGEGDAGTGEAVFSVRLSQASTSPVVFDVRSFAYDPAGNRATDGVDFLVSNYDDLRIEPGQTAVQFSIPVLGDTLVEQDESFYLFLTGITGAVVGDNIAVGWIRNDDGIAERPTIAIADLQVAEGNTGTPTAAVNVSLSAAAAGAVRFGLASADGSALAGEDYDTLILDGLEIPAGQTSASFNLTLRGDTTAEDSENLTIRLTNIVGAGVTDREATVTILNDDGGAVEPPLVARDDRWVLRENAGTTAINVLANDVFDPARLAGGSLAIIQAATLGAASLNTNGTPGDATDDTLRYTPFANTSGEDLVGYRACEAGGRCSEGLVQLVVRPSLDVSLDTESAAGWTDLPMTGLRALPDPVWLSAEPTFARVFAAPLTADATTENPWDGGDGTAVLVRTGYVPASPMRVLADATGDLDLYLGVDSNNNGLAEASELRCTAAMSSVSERCEITLTTSDANPTTDAVNYWVMLHNRSAATLAGRAEVFELYLEGSTSEKLQATAPGVLAAGESFPLRLSWFNPFHVPGEPMLGYVGLRPSPGAPAAWFPVRLDRTGNTQAPQAMEAADFYNLSFHLDPGQAHEHLFVDVPEGATRLTVDGASLAELHLAKAGAPTNPAIAAAPPRSEAVLSATGNQPRTLVLEGPQLTPGRWYLTFVNTTANRVEASVRVAIEAAAPAIRPGSYFNAGRSGHGLFVYPAGGSLAGLWYTYLQDGSPTWYYLQGAAPGASGIWNAELYRSAWDGDSNRLTRVGAAIATPTAGNGFTFSYRLDGEWGSEPMAPLGRGCPSLAGQVLDVSSHWYDPARAGAGYSVQMFPNYEFHAVFAYDGRGVPRFLVAESPAFAGADATLDLAQLQGFCPLCTRTGNPTRADVGTLQRRFANGSFEAIEADAVFGNGLPGAWSAIDAVQPLGGAGTTQGCVTP